MYPILTILIYLLSGLETFASTQPYKTKHLSGPTDNEVIFLLVDKKTLKAELKTWPDDHLQSETLLTLKIAVGKALGDKQVEGDNKTPEGIYFTQELINGNTLPAKYGPFAIPINFPNTFDRSEGKPAMESGSMVLKEMLALKKPMSQKVASLSTMPILNPWQSG